MPEPFTPADYTAAAAALLAQAREQRRAVEYERDYNAKPTLKRKARELEDLSRKFRRAAHEREI